jgi:KaiC/GvpD/RAD55 family RecA-like ATPase
LNLDRQAALCNANFDRIAGGGLPRGRTTLPVGESGAGKAMLALQGLVYDARAGR